MPTKNAKNILVAPLDWGLGHTTRCVPVIRYLQQLGHTVVAAGNKAQCSFFARSFSHINTLHLEGYDITYSHWNQWAQAGLLAQLPAIHKKIQAEHNWVQKKTAELGIDGIISDNRYGLYHPDIPSVIMTHQLHVLSGMGNMIDRAVQRVHYRHLDRFDSIWVVDVPAAPGLAGKLSHPVVLPKQHEWMGLLSQFDAMYQPPATDDSLVVLLSGPEPQRSELSQMLWRQAVQYQGKVIYIEGKEDTPRPSVIPEHIVYHKRLTHDALEPLLKQAAMVICRSGYSTIMDLTALRKKAVLIPTPGQTEQEYLAEQLHAQGIFYRAKQKGFKLDKALKEAAAFPYQLPVFAHEFTRYKTLLDEWLETLK